MKYVIPAIMTALIAVLPAGCTSKPGEPVMTGKKVTDQLLATYAPLRRLTYRDACGSEGTLTVCVDRITISDTATLVETRIRNSSKSPYFRGYASGATAVLTNAADETGSLIGGNAGGNPQTGEMKVQFRMEGHFRGEPAALAVNGSGKSAASGEFPVVVRLGT
jgi:hypothetical protein